ncbi:MAG: hypothetical protein JWM93_697 [Frankiales bacterium]|nr:hypothetical protein [Frankiales bacterium]
MASKPAPGGGRYVEIPPERLQRWLDGFRERHGTTTVTSTPNRVDFSAADGARAECDVPFAPLTVDGTAAHPADGGLLEHVERDRRVGVLLVRLGGYAAGIFDGTTLVSSKVGSRQVHGRNSNGGWSQHRYARRREGQVKEAIGDSADVAVRILMDPATLATRKLEAVVLGGETKSVEAVMADPRLQHLEQLVEPRILDVPDPKLTVLQRTPDLFRAVRIRVLDPAD